MQLAQAKRNHYYSITDGLSAYCIAIVMLHDYCQLEVTDLMWWAVLHPGLKFKYFHLHKWQDEWINVVENLVHEEYIKKYENHVHVAYDEISDKVCE
jgi:hypothetical protein